MENKDQIRSEIIGFAEGYVGQLIGLLQRLDCQQIADVIEELDKARTNQNTVFIIGNGGSAATASHMATDFGMIARKTGNQHYIKAISLTDNIPLITAISNDYGYEFAIVEQLKVNYRKGDKLLAISASGNSPNIVNAAQYCKDNEGVVIGFTGFNGGKLKELSDISVHIETNNGEYGQVEDIHLIIDHIITKWFYQ